MPRLARIVFAGIPHHILIRLLLAQAALLAGQVPSQLSFKHTVQLWLAWQQRGGGTHAAVVDEFTVNEIARDP